tara:strand:+ start:1057 stop:1461 length:405 start_codon:yes stop_codon:yes gene_type:complete
MVRKIKLVLTSIGLINATFLTYKHLTRLDYCVVGNSCEKVLSSSYSTLFGFPLGLYGVIFFSILLYVLLQNNPKTEFLNKIEMILLSIGGIISVLLMSIQFMLLRSFCIYCTLSATIIILLIIATILNKKGKIQ